MKTSTLKKLVLALLLLVAGIVVGPLAFSPAARASENHHHGHHGDGDKGDYKGGVTDDMVIAFLESKGYTNVRIIETYDNGDRLCKSDFPYYTIVHVDGDQIIGAEDIGQ